MLGWKSTRPLQISYLLSQGRYGIFAAGNNSRDAGGPLQAKHNFIPTANGFDPSYSAKPASPSDHSNTRWVVQMTSQSTGYPKISLIGWGEQASQTTNCKPSRAYPSHIFNPSRLSMAVAVEAVQLSYNSVGREIYKQFSAGLTVKPLPLNYLNFDWSIFRSARINMHYLAFFENSSSRLINIWAHTWTISSVVLLLQQESCSTMKRCLESLALLLSCIQDLHFCIQHLQVTAGDLYQSIGLKKTKNALP